MHVSLTSGIIGRKLKPVRLNNLIKVTKLVRNRMQSRPLTQTSKTLLSPVTVSRCYEPKVRTHGPKTTCMFITVTAQKGFSGVIFT